MANYKTPDVYVEEISTLPPSVAGVSTAVPAFIGYTKKANKEGKEVVNDAIRISTFLEYKEIFGGPPTYNYMVAVSDNSIEGEITKDKEDQYLLYYAMDFYFKNGGGECYIISVGNYEHYSKDDFLRGLKILEKEDEPTLILLSDAVHLAPSDYFEVCQQALAQCANLMDRFCIFDVLDLEEGVQVFRDSIGTSDLKYGAAYTPYLMTSINYQYEDEDVKINGVEFVRFSWKSDDNGVEVAYIGKPGEICNLTITAGEDEAAPLKFQIVEGTNLTLNNVAGKTVDQVLEAWSAFGDKGSFSLMAMGDKSVPLAETPETPLAQEEGDLEETLATIKVKKTSLYGMIQKEMTKQRVTLPPSSGVAGIYCKIDGSQGVWKAPANVSMAAVIAPTEKITAKDQEKLNVDPDAGKSINAIRGFVGKGTLIWGARTLAGNDNEWRYISVRRLFNMIEESTKKASYFAVFESNDATTWLKVKAMIESFLYGLWQQGALAGAVAEQSYFVHVGLGQTMTVQDILEGRMIVEIGIAAVRPAEFIILKFSHKLQES